MRNGSDYTPEKVAVAVAIELADGSTLTGVLWVLSGKTLSDALNGSVAFVEFMPHGQDRTKYVAKSYVTGVTPLELPKTVPLYERRGASNADDPYHILAIAPNSSWHAVREAYVHLAKTYHPDRFSGVQLPGEVLEYINAKARRINAAYALLEGSLKRAVERAVVQQSVSS